MAKVGQNPTLGEGTSKDTSDFNSYHQAIVRKSDKINKQRKSGKEDTCEHSTATAAGA